MTILCSGDCHVWLGSSSLCTCEAHRGPSGPTLAMYGLPQNYNPFSPHAPQPTPAPDVPLAQFKAAQEAGASHLSADGKRIYTVRYGKVLQAEWDGARFGAWLEIGEEMPADAVILDKEQL